MRYRHLTDEQRYDIATAKSEGVSLDAIARKIGCSKSTISREVARNSGLRGYRPKQAHELAMARLRKRRGGCRPSAATWRRCQDLIRSGHSPEQATGRAEAEGLGRMSHETVYQRVYSDKAAGGRLHTHLRCQKKRRKRYGSGRSRRGRIPNRVGIEHRCPRVEARSTVGHWEADTMIGRNKKSVIVTLVERKSGYAVARKVPSRESHHVENAVIDALKGHRRLVRTITFDNGLEFAGHERVARLLGAKTYFADPYSSWQRGTNENWNGLLRQYLPKKSCFRSVSVGRLEALQRTLNTRARKRLNWHSPREVFMASLQRTGVALTL